MKLQIVIIAFFTFMSVLLALGFCQSVGEFHVQSLKRNLILLFFQMGQMSNSEQKMCQIRKICTKIFWPLGVSFKSKSS